MRPRTLSDDGLHLYLNAITTSRPRHWYEHLICNLFHSDYDDRLHDVVATCRESTKALCALFGNPTLETRLQNAVRNTVKLILDASTKRQREKDLRFFTDVMKQSFKEEDHQTAHMLHTALTRPQIAHVRRPKSAGCFETVGLAYGAPNYEKHLRYWRTVRTDQILPSLIAFNRFVRRRTFMGRKSDVEEANEYMDIYKYLEHDKDAILAVYKMDSLSF
jgi:hypothetical protein